MTTLPKKYVSNREREEVGKKKTARDKRQEERRRRGKKRKKHKKNKRKHDKKLKKRSRQERRKESEKQEEEKLTSKCRGNDRLKPHGSRRGKSRLNRDPLKRKEGKSGFFSYRWCCCMRSG